jgi:hypothetical protein
VGCFLVVEFFWEIGFGCEEGFVVDCEFAADSWIVFCEVVGDLVLATGVVLFEFGSVFCECISQHVPY